VSPTQDPTGPGAQETPAARGRSSVGSSPAPGAATAVTGYIPTLDGWRAIAILLVLVAHGRFRLVGPDSGHPDEWWNNLLSHAVVGVPIFFGISGLLICSRLLDESRLTGSISLRGFYTRRFFRILPPYLLAIAAIVAMAHFSAVDIPTGDVASSLFFYRNYWPTSAASGWYTIHFWSLAVEEHFYLILPGLLILCGRRSLATILWLAAGVAIWRAIQAHTSILPPGVRFLTYRTDIRIDGLLLGAAAAFVLVSPTWIPRFRRFLTAPFVLICLLVIAGGLWRNVDSIDTVVALLVPLVLLGTVLRPTEMLGRILEWGPLRWIGRISYSLYLWQQLFFAPVRVPLEVRQLPHILPEWTQTIPWNLACLFACATASYYVLERPLTRLGRRLARPTTEGRPI
jgi:peptidoglycan/LPS O-acetylase OafA/YrhL